VAVTVTITSGSVLDFGTRTLVLTSAGTFDAGAGSMAIRAANLVLQPGARLASAGGSIDVQVTGDIDVQTGASRARIDVSGSSGGNLTLTAGDMVSIDGLLLAAATAAAGDGGLIDVSGSAVRVGAEGRVSAMGGRSGIGGDVTLAAADTDLTVAGTLDASGLDGGAITLEANQDMTVTASGVINAKSAAGGSGDEIDLTAFTGAVSIAGEVVGSAGGSLDFGGSGADVVIEAARHHARRDGRHEGAASTASRAAST
jgi:hypothetical protein